MKAARKDAPFSLRNGKLQSTGREESGHESERSHDPAASASLVSKLGDIGRRLPVVNRAKRLSAFCRLETSRSPSHGTLA
jgi:hypothetical protein